MIEATDLAYRLGMADGLKQGQMQAQQAQMQQMQQAMMQPQIDPATGQPIPGGQPGMDPAMGGQPGMDPMAGGAPMDPSMDPAMAAGMDPNAMGGQDLEPGAQSEMDQYINELEELVAKGEKPSVIEVRKRVEAITNLRKSQKAKMKQNQPAVTAAQKKLVNGILAKWEKETKVTSENLEDVLKESGLKLE
jgi:hypothetical protein